MKSNKFLYLTVNNNPSRPNFFICGRDIRTIYLMIVLRSPKLLAIYDALQSINPNFGRINKEGTKYVSEIDFRILATKAREQARADADADLFDEVLTMMDSIEQAKGKLRGLHEFILKQLAFFNGVASDEKPSKKKSSKKSKAKHAEEYEADVYDTVDDDDDE